MATAIIPLSTFRKVESASRCGQEVATETDVEVCELSLNAAESQRALAVYPGDMVAKLGPLIACG